ncbi:putative NAD(P)H nitroreductase YdjA [compost metagenome]
MSTTSTSSSSLSQVVRDRRSIKGDYTDEPVPQELVLQILNDAIWAPNHGLREPWRFIFVRSEDKQAFAKQLAATFSADQQEKRNTYFNEPSAFLIVVMPVDPRQKQWDEDYGAVSALIQNFQLLAWEHRLGTVWKTNPQNYDPKGRALLGVQPGEKIVGFIHLGFFNEVPKAGKRTPAEEKFTVYNPLAT